MMQKQFLLIWMTLLLPFHFAFAEVKNRNPLQAKSVSCELKSEGLSFQKESGAKRVNDRSLVRDYSLIGTTCEKIEFQKTTLWLAKLTLKKLVQNGDGTVSRISEVRVYLEHKQRLLDIFDLQFKYESFKESVSENDLSKIVSVSEDEIKAFTVSYESQPHVMMCAVNKKGEGELCYVLFEDGEDSLFRSTKVL